MAKQSDKDLMDLIQAGDETAFTALVARYSVPLQRHIMKLARDQAAAEDLLQETFLRVWTRAEQWSGDGTCRAWLYTISTNLARNWLRTISRRRERPLETGLEGDSDEEGSRTPDWWIEAKMASPEEEAVRGERRNRLAELISLLPEEKAAVLKLVYENELAPQEVAEVLNIPAGTVRSRLYHARKRLALLWDEEEWEV